MGPSVSTETPKALSESQRAALVTLLADDDASVYQLVREKILSQGQVAVSWMQPHVLSSDPILRRRAQEIIDHLAEHFAVFSALADEGDDPPDATSDQSGPPLLDEDYLILSTIHSAKGQEWRSVHVLNVVDGCIPSDLGTGSTHELEEERRLLYVAMTRARDDLSRSHIVDTFR